jgi:hypothetical protein
MQRIILALAVTIVVAGCGNNPSPNRDLGLRNRSVLTADEIQMQKGGAWTAYDVIARLRPEYLRSRGASSLRNTTPVTAVVYLDEMRYGTINALKQMSADQIWRIEYINAADATTRFGTDHLGGAILVYTK